jgi:hypothetical protein
VTKRTPLEGFHAARLDALEEAVTEAEKTLRAETDPALSPNERLAMFKRLQAWPRIVLAIYETELAIAQKDRNKRGSPGAQREEPSEVAYAMVGDALGLGPDRIRDLCREARRHQRQGLPPKHRMRAAEFIAYLRKPRKSSQSAGGTVLPRKGHPAK